MRKIILNVATSLDGKIEGPNGEYDWCFSDQDYGMKDFLSRIDTILFGRRSYEMMMQFDGSDPFSHHHKYVFSKTLQTTTDPYLLVESNLGEFIKDLTTKSGKDIWLFGGAGLASSFLREGLLDEIWMAVHPLLLGPGKSLFTDLPPRIQLELKENIPFSSGLIHLKYKILKV